MPKLTPTKRVLFVRRFIPVLLVLFAVLSTLAISLRAPHTASAATQSTINFQARLQSISGAIVPDGSYNVQFKLYDAASSGTLLWTESYYDSNGVTAGNDNRVTVTNGYLSVSLGSQTAFPGTINWDQQLWLTMNVGGTTQTATPTYDGEMNPRLALTAVPYAFSAGELTQANAGGTLFSSLNIAAPTVGNQNFVIQDQGAAGTYNLLTAASGTDGYIKLQAATPGTVQSGNFNINGTGIAGVALQAPLMKSAAATALTITANAASTWSTSAGLLTISGAGGVTIDSSAAAQTISIGTSAVTHTIAIGNNAGAAQTITVGSTNTGSTTTIVGGGSSLAVANGGLTIAGNTTTSGTVSTTAGGAAGAGTQMLSSNLYIQSRGTGLVTNGSGLLGNNYNFPSQTFVQDDKPVGATGAFLTASTAGNNSITTTELIPVSPSRYYEYTTTAKQVVGQGRYYMTIAPYDSDNLSIQPYHYMVQVNTTTTLAAPLNPGDTTMTLTSAANWNNAAGGVNTHLRSAIFWDWVDGKGYAWPAGTYSRYWSGSNFYADGAIVGNVITLNAPYAGVAHPAGTAVSNGSSGGSYMYIGASNAALTSTWTTYTGRFGGGTLPTYSTVAATTTLPLATTAVKVGFLTNYNQTVSPSQQSIANVQVSEVEAGYAAFTGPTSLHTYTLPNADATLLTTTSGVQLQGSTPGSAQTGHFNITGTGIAGVLQAPTVQSAAATALTITGNAASTWSTSAGLLTINGAAGVTMGLGTGNFILNGAAASTYTIGAATTTGTITIGGTAQTGDLILGSSSGTNTVKIANGSGAGTVNIANVQTGGAVNIGAGMTTGTITIGGTGAQTGTIAIGTGTGAQTISVGTGSGAKTITVGSTNAGSTANLVGGASSIAVANGGITVTGNTTHSGNIFLNGVVDSLAAPYVKVQTSLGNNVLTVASAAYTQVGINLGGSVLPSLAGNGVEIQGAIRLTGGATGNVDSFLTPVGSSVGTKINVPIYDPGNFGQIIAFGLPSAANATSRAISLFDARTVAHQPTITVFSPDENQVFGLSWEGSNTKATLKTSGTDLILQANNKNLLTASYLSSTTGRVMIGDAAAVQGSLSFANSTNMWGVLLTSGTPGSDFTIQLPDAIGAAGQCVAIAGVVSTTETLGYTSCLTSTSGIQNQIASAQASSNFWISGTGNANLFQAPSFDTVTAGALAIGATHANAVNITPDTTISGQIIGSSGLILSGTYTTSSAYRMRLTGTLNSSITTSQYGFDNSQNFNPSGASLNAVYGLVNLATISGSALNINQVFGSVTGIATGAGYTGKITNGYGMSVSSPSVGGSQYMDTYSGLSIGTNSTNGGNTTGTISNNQIRINGVTAAAGSGGTVNNYGISMTIPSGAGAGTTNNYGLYLSGAGGGTANWSLYNASSAASYYAGNVLIGTTSNANNYELNIQGTAAASTSLLTPSLDTATGVPLNIGTGNATNINIGTNAANHTISIGSGAAVEAVTIGSTTGASNLTLQGGLGGITMNANNIVVNNGASNVLTIDATGKTTFKPVTDAADAFKVQNAAGTSTVLTADTTNKRVGIGTNAPTSALHVSVNNSISTVGTTLLQQQGSGDSSIQFQNATGSFFAGQDSSDSNKYKISSSIANASAGAVLSGNTTTNGGFDSGNSNMITASKIANTSAGTVTSVTVYVGTVAASPNNHMQVALYTDAAGVPGTLVANSGSQVVTANSWNTFAISGSVSASTNYWLAFNVDSNTTQYGTSAGGLSSSYQTSVTYGTWPGTYSQSSTSGTYYSIYMSVSTAASDEFATSLFSLSQTGQTIFQNSTNSTIGFQVNNASAATIFNIDTTNSRVGIGTNAPTTTAHISVNNSSVTSPMALIEQTGTGDATLQIKTPAKSWLVGADASDSSKLKISSSTASGSATTFGKSSIGGSEDSTDQNNMECSKWTAGSTGTVTSMSVYAMGAIGTAPNNKFQVGIYANGASKPGTLIANSSDATLSAADAWSTATISASVTSGTVYWLCVNNNATSNSLSNWAYDTGAAGSSYYIGQTYGTWPSTFGTGTSDTQQFSMYATMTITGSYDSFNKALLTMSDTGQTTFQNSVNSATAFDVQNSDGASLFTADTAATKLILGDTGAQDVFTALPSALDNTTHLTNYSSAWSPDNQYLSVTHASTTPWVSIYKRSGETFTKLPDITAATGSSYSSAWSPDGQYLTVGSVTSPYLTIYKHAGDTFTKLTVNAPNTAPAGAARGVAWSADGTYLSVAHTTTPFLTIYKRSGDTFTKLTVNAPNTIPTSNGLSVAFSPDINATYLSIAVQSSPYIVMYKRSGDTWTKLTTNAPDVAPTGLGYNTSWSPDMTYMSVAHDTSPFVSIYKRSADTFIKLTNPSALPTGTGYGSSWSPDGLYLSVAHANSPYVTTYSRSGDTFTKLADPAITPGSQANNVAWSPSGTFMSVATLSAPYTTVYRHGLATSVGGMLQASQDIEIDGILRVDQIKPQGTDITLSATGGSINIATSDAGYVALWNGVVSLNSNAPASSYLLNLATSTTLGSATNDALNLSLQGAPVGGGNTVGIGMMMSRTAAGTGWSNMSLNIGRYTDGTRQGSISFYGSSMVCISTWTCVNTLGVGGSIGASGSITASTTPDIAETIAAAPDVEAADIVMADPDNTERVVKTQSAYSSAAVGVISDGTSGFMINAHSHDETAPLNGKPLVLAGRVPVKVTNQGGAIKPGDYLTSSSTPGMAMKALHGGPTIGKALGFFDGTTPTGTVLVLVSNSYYDPSMGQALQAASITADDINVSGTATIKTLHVTGDATIDGTLTAQNIIVNGHIVTGGTAAPTVTVFSNAGKDGSVTVTGNDSAGTITVKIGLDQTGYRLAAGDIAKLVFDKPFGKAPVVMLTPADGTSAAVQVYPNGRAPEGFALSFVGTPQQSTTYTFQYLVVQ